MPTNHINVGRGSSGGVFGGVFGNPVKEKTVNVERYRTHLLRVLEGYPAECDWLRERIREGIPLFCPGCGIGSPTCHARVIEQVLCPPGMKLIIAGGRDLQAYTLVEMWADRVLTWHDVTEVVCGDATGADSLGERWANAKGIPVKHFPADWDGLGKKAGLVRNGQMAAYGTALLAFWDGRSRGTADMIEKAKWAGLKVKVVTYKNT
jgi:hypothetical protein